MRTRKIRANVRMAGRQQRVQNAGRWSNCTYYPRRQAGRKHCCSASCCWLHKWCFEFEQQHGREVMTNVVEYDICTSTVCGPFEPIQNVQCGPIA